MLDFVPWAYRGGLTVYDSSLADKSLVESCQAEWLSIDVNFAFGYG